MQYIFIYVLGQGVDFHALFKKKVLHAKKLLVSEQRLRTTHKLHVNNVKSIYGNRVGSENSSLSNHCQCHI